MTDASDNWLSHGFKKAASQLQVQAALSWGLVVAVAAILGVISLLQGSQIIVSGYQMQQMSAELRELQEANTLLEAKIAAGQAVSTLRDRATALGFVLAGPEQIEYLPVREYPPGPVPDEARPAAGEELSADTRQAVWETLIGPFRGWRRYTAGSARSTLDRGGG
jgi:hypothetical protein